MRARLDLSYDGSAFHGWARQDGLRTVQGELENALTLLLGTPALLSVAGRTDAGVHARGQVAHIDVSDDINLSDLQRRLQRIVPDDIAVASVSRAPDGFDARFSAIERRYIYRLSDHIIDPLQRNHIVFWPRALNTDAMNAAGELLLGEHDFAAFCKKRAGATTIRTLKELSTTRRDSIIETTVRADAFCHSMVRSLMGVLIAVGEGRFEPNWARVVLESQERNSQAKVMPAHGLILEEVLYPADDQLAKRASQTRQMRIMGD